MTLKVSRQQSPLVTINNNINITKDIIKEETKKTIEIALKQNQVPQNPENAPRLLERRLALIPPTPRITLAVDLKEISTRDPMRDSMIEKAHELFIARNDELFKPSVTELPDDCDIAPDVKATSGVVNTPHEKKINQLAITYKSKRI